MWSNHIKLSFWVRVRVFNLHSTGNSGGGWVNQKPAWCVLSLRPTTMGTRSPIFWTKPIILDLSESKLNRAHCNSLSNRKQCFCIIYLTLGAVHTWAISLSQPCWKIISDINEVLWHKLQLVVALKTDRPFQNFYASVDSCFCWGNPPETGKTRHEKCFL